MKSMLKSLMSVAAAALALTSCSNDATEEVILKGEPKTLEVNATIDRTRTYMADNHVDLKWSDDDQILLYIGETATEPNIINPVSGGKITATYNNGDNVYANYSLDNEKFSKGVTQAEIKIDGNQTQSAANVFAGVNLPMVAKGTIANGAVNLTFQPVGCVLVFNVYGPAENEKTKSITFETSVGCYGYKNCDLTAETLGYAAYEKGTSATVTLDTPAAIGTSKPADTKIGENQVYLVVAPAVYPEGSKFTVTTDVGETYTFTTTTVLDCSQNTARVVNLNLAKAPEMKPAIEVPTVAQQPSEGGDFTIDNIVFKHFAAEEVANATAGVYSDAELTQNLGADAWLTIRSSADLASGQLTCTVAPNETTAERIAYIGIHCAGLQAAIAVKQVGKGTSTAKYFVKVTENLSDWTGNYLIVYEPDACALNGALFKDQPQNNISVTITEQGILSTEIINAALVKISKCEGATGYILQAASESYFYSPSDKNQLSYSTNYETAKKHPNSISIESGSAKIESHKSVMRFNKASDQMRFRYYKSSSYNGQQPIQLYKLQE